MKKKKKKMQTANLEVAMEKQMKEKWAEEEKKTRSNTCCIDFLKNMWCRFNLGNESLEEINVSFLIVYNKILVFGSKLLLFSIF